MTVNLIVILGPTASGKTKLAARLAKDRGAEIISADSRQVYRGMDIGTGKDLGDYRVDGFSVPCHLINIVDPDYEFNVFDYQRHFFQCFAEIRNRHILPVLVGGTGLYLDAVLRGYRMPPAPEDEPLRAELEGKETEALVARLRKLNPTQHNTTDTGNRQRLIRAIEIAECSAKQKDRGAFVFPALNPLVIGIRWERTILRRRITIRLRERLAAGMIEEVQTLHDKGIGWEKLHSFGLEYRYIALYLQGKLDYEDMFRQLNTRIHQFAKRQETWFRRMEKKGIPINWLDEPQQEKLASLVKELLS